MARAIHPSRPVQPSLDDQRVDLRLVRGFLEGAQARGIDLPALFAQHGLEPLRARTLVGQVPVAGFARLLDGLQRQMRDEWLGLVSRPVKPGTLSLALGQMVRAATLGDALRQGFAVYRLTVDDFRAQVRSQPGDGRLCRVVLMPAPRHRMGTFVQAAFLYWTLGIASWLVQQRIPVHEIVLRAEAPVPETVGLDKPPFGVAERFDTRSAGLAFDARWLAQPIAVGPADLPTFLAGLPAGLLVPYRPDRSLAAQVRTHLLRQQVGALPSLEHTARSLAMAPHLLRRRLAAEGWRFQDIKNTLRRDAAIRCLLETDDDLTQIALQLGFSEASTFHRSFKHWTGTPPGVYRQRHSAARSLRPTVRADQPLTLQAPPSKLTGERT